MSIWTEQLTARAARASVLDVLTDPASVGRWAPVPFEVDELDGDRLQTGTRTVVSGRLAGREVTFVVEVLDAREERLALVARGPIDLDVEYVLRAVADGSEVRATIGVAGRGLGGRMLAHATAALLAAGALRTALLGLAREAEGAGQREKRTASAATASTRSRPLALAA